MATRVRNFDLSDLKKKLQKHSEEITKECASRAKRIARQLCAEKDYPPASDAGEAPAMRTGDLYDLIDTEEYQTGGKKRYKVVSDMYYSLWLEFGTSKMAPRPFLRPAIAQVQKQIADIAKKVYDKL